MSDITRSEALKELKEYVEGLDMEYATPFDKAILVAIASLETDEAYQLEYESTTNNDCETCIHNKGVLECDMYGCEYEPTTKNETLVSLGSYKQVAFERDIAVEQLKELGYQLGEKVRKADDCISRAYLLDDSKYHTVFNDDTGNFEDVVYREDIEKAPSVKTQEPKPMVEIDLDYVIKQKYIEREVLDKIRAETYQKLGTHGNVSLYNRAIYDVLQIIDKYRTESEEV